ncbi:MAG: IS66 family transposase [Gemmatimonadota bacterium]|nr:IS66 family transposase [Gemmatimonadota bacterium]
MSIEAVHSATYPEEINALIAQKDAEIARLSAHLQVLREQINVLTAKRFGHSSEKYSLDQLRLFNEAELAAPPAEEITPETIEIPAHRRRAGGRKPLPPQLPRIEIVHDLAEEEKICPHDGVVLTAIGEEISEQLDIEPAKVRVLRHVRRKYACPHCQQGVKTAALPPQPIPKSLASPGLAAHITVGKYQDGLPLYRQEKILARIGMEISRATLAFWMIQLGRLIQPVINLLRDEMLAYDILQMDETTVQVLKEPGKTAQSKSYLWVQRGGPPGRPVILFDYDPSRSQSVPLRLLEGYRGYLHVDGYEGYNGIGSQRGIQLVGCMAHARRKFDEALKAQGNAHQRDPTKVGHAQQGLLYIQDLYRIERELKTATPEDRHRVREEKAKPLLETIRTWLDTVLPAVPPESLTGKALYYLHHQWPKLIRYLEDGRLSIDNNAVENAIRPFVMGRKAWLFCDTVHGAKSSANLYGLIETSKACGHEPYYYLRHLFTELPKAKSLADIETLLPFNLKPAQISRSPP